MLHKGCSHQCRLSPHTPAPPLQALGEIPTRASMPQSVSASNQPPPPQALKGESHRSECVHPSRGCLIPLPPEKACTSLSVAASLPSHLSKQVCPSHLLPLTPSRLGREERPEGDPHAEVGPKPKVSPKLRSCATKEEELKSLCTTAQAMD